MKEGSLCRTVLEKTALAAVTLCVSSALERPRRRERSAPVASYIGRPRIVGRESNRHRHIKVHCRRAWHMDVREGLR